MSSAGPGAALPAGEVRWIPPLVAGGQWQMAIDDWLLDAALTATAAEEAAAGAMLRLYGWSRPTLSLGFHQRRIEPRWQELAAAGVIELVRRPSGGRAVLHAGEITYALVWPKPPPGRVEAYRQACGWLQATFAALARPLNFGTEPAGQPPSSCFASSTAADLVHDCGAKRIGSAQLWRRGAVLQHGSILLDPPAKLWRDLFGTEPPALPPLPVKAPELGDLLRAMAERHLPIGPALVNGPLQADELTAIAARLERYTVPGVTMAGESATSPPLTMPLATWPRSSPRG